MKPSRAIILRVIICALLLTPQWRTPALAEEAPVVARVAVGGADILNTVPYVVLKLALERSGRPVRFETTDVPYNTPYERNQELENGFNVIYAGDYPSREPYWKAVRISIMYGLTGYRMLVIRRDSREDFAQIRTIKELGRLQAVLPKRWVMTKVLQDAGMAVVYGDTKNVLTMLAHDRADYYPGLVLYNASTTALAEFPDLMIEETMLLESTHLDVFLVDNRDDRLHEAIETGLTTAYSDGSLLDLLRNHPSTQGIAEKMRLDRRRILSIDNPLMRPEAAAALEDFLQSVDAESARLTLK